MSAVLAADSWATILPVIRRLKGQTARGELEIVLVLPAGESAAVEAADLREFAGFRLVERRA